MAPPASPTLIELAKTNASYYVPTFELRVKGAPLPRNVVRDVAEVVYEDNVDKVDGFHLSLANWDATERRPKYVGLSKDRQNTKDAKLFSPGNEVQLFMGYQGDLTLLMTGYITMLDVEYREDGATALTVHGLNVIDRLRQRQFTWTWPDDGAKTIRDSDVALALARPADDKKGRPGLGMRVRIDKGARDREPPVDHIMMNNEVPIVFLLERARRRGYEVTIDEEIQPSGKSEQILYFGPTISLKDVSYVLEWGKSLTSFKPVFSSAKQLYAVTVTGWDRRKKAKISERVTLDSMDPVDLPNKDLIEPARVANREDVITDHPVKSKEEAKRHATDILREQQHQMITAAGETVGLVDLRAGRVVAIRGTGVPFDGKYFVTGTRHTIGINGYRTRFQARRINPET
ncbi:phage late control D family protein [Oceaniovalibus sp. ACAM 378]|uniref:phage late control D family protein n=1 Tax=Oceaniovalibus sp. ACAM 378 TaxID=2599923 RepID=UPI0011D49459|nr:phage late control D family protein [Oceaniovalibus sp. ACAM 378]TYB89926.1 phage late control D family protein [Oceaniovalibus sp. ACAM 378]